MAPLRFACIPGCTRCCSRPGVVYLTESDLIRAAKFVGLSRELFEERYVCRSPHRLRLRPARRGQCPFLESAGCAIHPCKPVQCRLFPFWPELVSSPQAWAETARLCPGIGTGPVFRIGTALEIAHEMTTAYPALYE